MKKSRLLLISLAGLCLLSACGGSGPSTTPPPLTTHFSVTAPATASAGAGFNFTVTALDSSNKVATSYSGTVHFTSTDAQAVLPANSTLTNGTGNFSVTLKTAAAQTITATDTATSSITGTSSSINVSSASTASHFSVTAPATATAGTAFSFTVTALDSSNNVVISYSGTVHFASTDSQATLPANSTLMNGAGTFSASMKTAGGQTITATDTVTGSIKGTSTSINVTSLRALTITSGAPPDGTTGESYGTPQSVCCAHGRKLTEDFFQLAASGGSGNYSFSWSASQGSSLPPGLACCNLIIDIPPFPGPPGMLNVPGVIFGTPTAAGSYNLVVTATDSQSPSLQGSANYTITISAASNAVSAKLGTPDQHFEHHHYKLIDLGTFGGPFATANTEPTEDFVDNAGAIVGGADTSIPTPVPGCYNPVNNNDCDISHAFVWRDDHLKDLGTLPGGNFSYAEGINNFGQITGVSENGRTDPASGNPQFHAVLWESGIIRDLGTLGGMSSFAGSINDQGQIMGVSLNDLPDPFSIVGLGSGTTLTQTRGFLWQNGKMRDLGSLGGPDTFAIFLNQRGQVAGMSYTSNIPDPVSGFPPMDPFLWENGRIKDLGNFGGTNPFGLFSGFVSGLNDGGQVTGTMTLSGDQASHAFLWNGEKLSDLGTLGGSFAVSYGINNVGEVVGFAGLPGDNVFHAFLWRNGVMTDLGTVDGDACSTAQNVNTIGQVVGSSQAPDGMGSCVNPFMHAFLWEKGGPSVDLNSLIPQKSPLQLTVASYISDRGEIVGGGNPLGCTDNDTCNHVYVLIPCDENHPDIEGCDYSLADTSAAADAIPPQTNQRTVSGTSEAKLSPAALMARLRSAQAGGNRRYGMPQTPPQ